MTSQVYANGDWSRPYGCRGCAKTFTMLADGRKHAIIHASQDLKTQLNRFVLESCVPQGQDWLVCVFCDKHFSGSSGVHHRRDHLLWNHLLQKSNL